MGGIHLEINVRIICHNVVMLQKKFHWILIGYLISMIILTVSMIDPKNFVLSIGIISRKHIEIKENVDILLRTFITS